jgi:nitronate monooxygenase
MARIETSLTRRLHIEHPILTAPMTGAVGGLLASAATQAGAFGIIAPGHDEAAIEADSDPGIASG